MYKNWQSVIHTECAFLNFAQAQLRKSSSLFASEVPLIRSSCPSTGLQLALFPPAERLLALKLLRAVSNASWRG